MPEDRPTTPTHTRRALLITLRYVLPAAFIVAGFVILAVVDSSLKWDGWAMCVGAGLSVALMNVLFRFGAKGDDERTQEEQAREFLAEHGHWPDEEAATPRRPSAAAPPARR
jgi:hypothetical protein